MRSGILVCLVAILPALVSCQSVPPKRISKEQEALEAAWRRFHQASRELKAGRVFSARELVKPLLTHPRIGREAKLLQQEVEFQLEYRTLKRSQDLSAKLAISEAEKRLVRPEKYGTYKVFDPKLGPFTLAKGPLEDLLDKPVELKLQNANLEALLIALSEIDGVNLIADDVLAADRTLTVSVKDVPLREVLGYIERNMGVSFVVGQNTLWVTEGEDTEERGPRLQTEIIRLRKGYIPAADGGDAAAEAGDGQAAGDDDLLAALTGFLEDNPDNPPNAKFQIFRNRNILMLRNTRDNIRVAQTIIEAFDQDPMQVLIEARFVTFANTDFFQLGTSIRNIRRDAGHGSIDGSSTLPGTTAPDSGRLEVGGILSAWQYDVVLSAIHQLSIAKTLTAPRITVINNHRARIRRGDVRYYFDEYAVESSGGESPVQTVVPEGEAIRLELGITLEVRPSIANDGKSVLLSLNTEIIDFIEFVQLSEEISLPRTNESTIETTVGVNSGETVILGGQLSATDNVSISKIPLLGDIPLIGFLFRKKEVSKEPLHLMIFITATIVDLEGRFNVVREGEAAGEGAGAAQPAAAP